MIAYLSAYRWRLLSRLALWLLRKQIVSASKRGDYARLGHLIADYSEMQTAHADHCEELQHLRAGR